MAETPLLLIARLNARLQPMHRGELFEDPLEEAMQAEHIGNVTGGGFQLGVTREIQFRDIEIELHGERETSIGTIIAKLEALGAPKQSKLKFAGESREIEFGRSEGLGLYLNGSDLAPEVYETGDVNFVYSELDRLTSGLGKVMSYWEGPSETAFYLYGASFDKMKENIQILLDEYPLCQRCRVERIA
ncbi:MAG TPA: hypothetical protein VF798_09525 [Burkholderiaceae bacterium]